MTRAKEIVGKSLACVVIGLPAFFIGALIGWVLLAALPGIVATEIWYGSEALRHPEIVSALGRPAMVIGGLIAVIVAVIGVINE
jgi:hypothetical protein